MQKRQKKKSREYKNENKNENENETQNKTKANKSANLHLPFVSWHMRSLTHSVFDQRKLSFCHQIGGNPFMAPVYGAVAQISAAELCESSFVGGFGFWKKAKRQSFSPHFSSGPKFFRLPLKTLKCAAWRATRFPRGETFGADAMPYTASKCGALDARKLKLFGSVTNWKWPKKNVKWIYMEY